ncbi:ATP-binding protein [candidate division KSB1 bacterium]|nr:ATP-binding protein [candidate division KSB1 bacterium]
MNASIKLVIASTMENIRLIGLAVKSISSLTFNSSQDCDFIETAIVEACTNVVKHAYKFDATQKIEIDIELNSNKIKFTITDEGRTFDPSHAKPFEFDPADIENLPEGGMGIYIFKSVMNDIQYVTQSGKNQLKMIKQVLPPS